MAAADSQVLRDPISTNIGHPEVSRQEIQAAIAKAVELRALHAALVHGSTNASSPSSNFRFPTAAAVAAAASLSSPVLHRASHFTAQDYPVFTPSYLDDPLPEYQQSASRSGALSESWDEHGLPGLENPDEMVLSHCETDNLLSRKGLTSNLTSLESHICPAEDQKSVTSSMLETSQGAESYVSSCNQCKPATITTESGNAARNKKNSKIVVPLTNSHSSVRLSQTKGHGISLSRLFPQLKKKHMKEASPNRTESEEASQISKDPGTMSVEALKKELIEANKHRDAALMEVAEMRSSLGELRQKLEYLETHCEGLKRALRQATQVKGLLNPETPGILPLRGKPSDGNRENSMPVRKEAMTEGFLQIALESRLSVKQFCKTLINQVKEADIRLTDHLNSLLQPYNLSLNSCYSKAVLYHLEAIINQMLYQDFENCTFQKNGSPKILDPEQDRQAQFASFMALRNLSWNEVLRKGTKYYSEDFSKFCDQKMSSIIMTLNWTRPWPEQLLQAFFVAAKCIWLLHLLAFSFSPPLGILRVEENRAFDLHYMEDIFADRQRSSGPSRVKAMVMPGFYVQERVLRCKVLCRYKPVA